MPDDEKKLSFKKKPGTKTGTKLGARHPSVVELARLAEKEEPVKVLDTPDLFAPSPSPASRALPRESVPAVLIETGGTDKFAHDTNILKLEWAIKYPLMDVTNFLVKIKGYSVSQADRLIGEVGGISEWQAERGRVLDKLTESVVKRHIDQIAEVQETHVKASKVGLAKAIEMLSKLSIEPAKDKEGHLIKDDKGKIVWRGFRSIDLLNIMGSIEKAQAIYRKAMGLPNDEGGLAQLMEKVSQLNVQNNYYGTGTPDATPKSELDKKVEETLSYDDLVEFIEYRREQKIVREQRMKDEAAKTKAAFSAPKIGGH